MLLVLLASSAAAEVRLDVAGHVREEEGLLVVRVDLTNHGTTAPRGLNALPPEDPVDVPAAGAATAPLRVLRAGAPPGSRAGIVVLAAEVDGPLERTAVASGRVEVVAPPAPWLPRVRVPLLVIALALLAAAVIVELWSFRSRPT